MQANRIPRNFLVYGKMAGEARRRDKGPRDKGPGTRDQGLEARQGSGGRDQKRRPLNQRRSLNTSHWPAGLFVRENNSKSGGECYMPGRSMLTPEKRTVMPFARLWEQAPMPRNTGPLMGTV